jgi:glycine betaine/choline ABC-type transport system substrate-binding protein
VLAGPRLAAEAPDVMSAVSGLDGAIDAARMRALNRMVDEQGLSARAAAESFLKGR